jgi:hypothetical protein
MSLFCLLWTPFFYLLWRAVTGSNSSSGGVWALIAGSVIALVQFFLGALVDTGGFGLSLWVSGCVDIVTVPALIPVLIYCIFAVFKIGAIRERGAADFVSFALLWLIPSGAMRALSWSAQRDPILLVLVPLLWTAVAVGVPFFIGIIINGCHYLLAAVVSLGILAVPFAATCSYWAFYAQKTQMGFLFLLAAAAPMLVSMILAFVKAKD